MNNPKRFESDDDDCCTRSRCCVGSDRRAAAGIDRRRRRAEGCVCCRVEVEDGLEPSKRIRSLFWFLQSVDKRFAVVVCSFVRRTQSPLPAEQRRRRHWAPVALHERRRSNLRRNRRRRRIAPRRATPTTPTMNLLSSYRSQRRLRM